MTPEALSSVMEATWPPLRRLDVQGFVLRDGAGGGKRVSAASARAGWNEVDIAAAATAMRDMGQDSLFMVCKGEDRLDQALAALGYKVVDPVVAYAMPTATLAPPAWMATFPHWPPMAIARDLWAAAGIGPARLAVMDRAAGAKTAILARLGDRVAGTAFVAASGPYAMLHALEVSGDQRRKGVAHSILQAAAAWANEQGCHTLSLVVTTANTGARALYEKCGMDVVGTYHYRQLAAAKARLKP